MSELHERKLQYRLEKAIRKIKSEDEKKKKKKREKRSAEQISEETLKNAPKKSKNADANQVSPTPSQGAKYIANIPIANSYGSLYDMEDEEFENADNVENLEFQTVTHRKAKNKPPTKEPVPPPIVICGIPPENFKKTMAKIIEIAGNEVVHFRITGKKMSVITYNKSTFKAVKEGVKNSSLEHFSYTLRDERQKVLVVRGIHSSTSIAEITDDLAIYGITPSKVIPMTKRLANNEAGRVAADLFQINFAHGTSIEQIRGINYLCRFRVTWEFKHKSAVTQCRRCQRFGHAASNCEMLYRCVKCNLQHQPGECQKTAEEEPACVNCSENHPANFKNCKVRSNYVSRLGARSNTINTSKVSSHPPKSSNLSVSPRQRFERQAQNNQSEPQKSNMSTNFVREGVSFAKALTPTTASVPSPPSGAISPPDNIFDFFDKEFQTLFKTDMVTFMVSLNEFYPEYVQLSCPNGKRKALLRFLCEVRGK